MACQVLARKAKPVVYFTASYTITNILRVIWLDIQLEGATYRELNSLIVSWTLVGWQQIANLDLAGSNNGAMYCVPTRCKSATVTFGIVWIICLPMKVIHTANAASNN